VTMVDVRGDDGSVDRLGMLALVPTYTQMCTHMCTHICILSAYAGTKYAYTHAHYTVGGVPSSNCTKAPQHRFRSDQCWVNVCPVSGPVDTRVHTTGGGASFSVGTDAKKMTVNVWTKGKYKFYDAERYHWRVQYCLIGY
jgi:hypothetical protein